MGNVAEKRAKFEAGKTSASKHDGSKQTGKPVQGCKLAKLLVTVVRKGKAEGNFKSAVFVQKKGGSEVTRETLCDKKCRFNDLDPGAYEVNVKPPADAGYVCLAKTKVTLPAAGEKAVRLELEKLKITKILPDAKRDQYVNLAADPKDLTAGRDVAVEAHVEPKVKDVTVHFAVEEHKDNKKSLPSRMQASGLDAGMQAKLSATSAKTDDQGVAKVTLSASGFGGDRLTVLASLQEDPKDKKSVTVKSKEITVWRRLWYQLSHHKDLAPPAMAKSVSQLRHVFIDFVAEPAVKHELAKNGEVVVGSHNAATYHALHKNVHPGRSVHVILCDQQIDAPAGLTNTVEAEFGQDDDYVQGTVGGTYVMHDPPLNGEKLFKSGSWTNPATGRSGSLTDDPAKTDDGTGLVLYNNKDFVEVQLPKNAAPSAAKKVKVTVEVTVASGPWGGDGGTAPHNLIVIHKDQTIHTMCVLHELGHLMNMGPMAYSVKCPPGFQYGDHTKTYQSNGAHCWSGGKLVKGKGDGGTCIMYHQLNTSCTLDYCDLCAPFVKAMELKTFNDLKK